MPSKYNSDNVLPEFRHFYGYLDATESVVFDLEQMLMTATDFEQLKAELLAYCQDRKDFLSSSDKLTVNSKYPRLMSQKPGS